MSPTDATRRQQFIGDLRSLATYLEDHGQVPIPRHVGMYLQVNPLLDSEVTDESGAIAEVGRIAEILGVPVTVRSGHHVAKLLFGRVAYKVVAIEASERQVRR
ncbi:hypothetical protein HNR40_008495 [Nonomuraea endophytica]|uniref:Uncharacterized protein n=2 Tax=Nonomuraea endophytica TaxID=714136 RepID=A0A7W8ELL6_9ACTN|nr:hypothetical protein [Nonomuraea endophytica]